MVVTLYQGSFFVAFLFGKAFDIFVADGFEAVGAPVLVGTSGLSHGISLVIAFFMNVGAESLVVDFMAIFALHGTYSLGQFELGLALHLDSVMSGLEGSQKFSFGHFVHFAFHHHDVVVGGTDHEFHVGFFELFESGIDYEFTVDTGNTHLRDGSVEWYVADCDCSRCSESGQRVGHVDTVGGIEGYVDESVSVVIVGEERTEHAVNEACGQDFVVRCASFTFEEAAGETSE